MAFKFKVKKRPNLAQAVAGAFTQGAVKGGQAALQKMIKDREDLKQQSTKELNLYTTLTNNLNQTADNKKMQADGKLKILSGKLAQDVFASQKDDFQYSSNVATQPIYSPDTGEVLAYEYKKNLLYPKKPADPVSGISIGKKREFDLYLKRVSDQEERIEALIFRKEFLPNGFTESDQESLDSLQNVQLPKSQQLLQQLTDTLGGNEGLGLETPVPTGTPESVSSDDAFSEYLDKNTGQ